MKSLKGRVTISLSGDHLCLVLACMHHSDFMLKLRLEMGDFIDDLQTLLVDLRGTERLKPLHLKYLAGAK